MSARLRIRRCDQPICHGLAGWQCVSGRKGGSNRGRLAAFSRCPGPGKVTKKGQRSKERLIPRSRLDTFSPFPSLSPSTPTHHVRRDQRRTRALLSSPDAPSSDSLFHIDPSAPRHFFWLCITSHSIVPNPMHLTSLPRTQVQVPSADDSLTVEERFVQLHGDLADLEGRLSTIQGDNAALKAENAILKEDAVQLKQKVVVIERVLLAMKLVALLA